MEQEGPRFCGPRCILIFGEATGIEGVSVIDEALANALVAAPLREVEHGNEERRMGGLDHPAHDEPIAKAVDETIEPHELQSERRAVVGVLEDLRREQCSLSFSPNGRRPVL